MCSFTPKRLYHLSRSRFLSKSLSAFSRPSYSHQTRTFLSLPQYHPMQSSRAPTTLPTSVYRWQEGVEDLEGYCSGGYHPTHIGDRYFNDRYEVVHKLGYGSYSTVWLAKDHLEAKYVAMKILIAATSKDCSESKILRILNSGKPDHPGAGLCFITFERVYCQRTKWPPPVYRERSCWVQSRPIKGS